MNSSLLTVDLTQKELYSLPWQLDLTKWWCNFKWGYRQKSLGICTLFARQNSHFFLGTTYCSEACSTEEISWGVKWVLETFFKISPHPSRRRKIWDTLIQVHFILDMHLCTLISRFDVLNFKHVFNTIFSIFTDEQWS